jgi:hypothetical protein
MTNEEKRKYFKSEVARIINTCSFENLSDTPDFIIADFLWYCFESGNWLVNRRRSWYAEKDNK